MFSVKPFHPGAKYIPRTIGSICACRAGLIQRINSARLDGEFILAVIRARFTGFGVFGFLLDAVDDHFVLGKRALIELVQTARLAQT